MSITKPNNLPSVPEKPPTTDGINSIDGYRRNLLEYAAYLVDQEVAALEQLNQLAAIEKVSNILKIDSQHLAFYLEHGDDEFERVYRYARGFQHSASSTSGSAGGGCNCGSVESTTNATPNPRAFRRQSAFDFPASGEISRSHHE